MADDWFDKNDPAQTGDWFSQNDPDTTSLVRQHTRNKPKKKTFAQNAVSLLPAAGGAVGEIGGGILGGLAGAAAGAPTGPGEVATIPAGVYAGRTVGAGAGAATGKLLQNALGPMVGLDPQPLGQGVGQEALLQGGITALGIPAFSKVALGGKAIRGTGAVSKLGQGAMELAGRLTPDAAKIAIREGITATKGGFDALMERLGKAGEFTDRLYELAGRRGVKFQMPDLATAAKQKVLPELQARGLAPDSPEIVGLENQANAWIKKHKTLLTPMQLKENIRSAGDDLAKLYKRLDRSKPITGTDLDEEQFLKAYVDEARAALRRLPDTGTRFMHGVRYKQGVQEAEKYTSDLIKLKDELEPYVSKQGSLAARLLKHGGPRAGAAAVGATIGATTRPDNRLLGGAEGAAIGGLISSPWLLSRIAFGLSDPNLAMSLGQLARPVVSGFNQPPPR